LTRALAPRNALGDALFLTGRLLHCRLLASQRDFSSHRLYLMASIAGSMLFCLIFIGTYAGMRELEAANAAGLIATIAAWAFLVYLFTDLFIAFGQALNDLYLSSDLALLFSLPLRGPSIIGAKFVLGVLQNEVYVGVFLLPFVFGFLLGVGAQWWAYPLALIGVAFFPAILYAALVVVTVVVLRVVPARVAKELLWLAGAAIPTMFWIVSFSRVARANGDIATMRLPPPPIWLPSTWLGHAVTFLGLGRVGPALEWLALLAVVTLVMGPIALAIVAKSFDAGFDANASRAAAVGAAEFTRLAGNPARVRFMPTHAVRSLRPLRRTFDVVIMDAPYERSVHDELKLLMQRALLVSGGVVVVEHSAAAEVELPNSLPTVKFAKYGDTALTFAMAVPAKSGKSSARREVVADGQAPSKSKKSGSRR